MVLATRLELSWAGGALVLAESVCLALFDNSTCAERNVQTREQNKHPFGTFSNPRQLEQCGMLTKIILLASWACPQLPGTTNIVV